MIAPTPDSTPPTAEPGRRLCNYRIASVLGRDPLGVVYEAVDLDSQLHVALRLLPDAIARDLEAVERWSGLIWAAREVRHPNLADVYELGRAEDGAVYLAAEFVAGGSAADRMAALGRLPWREASRLVADACRGMAAAHAAGLGHGRITPAHLLITPNGSVKVADLAYATIVRAAETGQAATPDARADVAALGATYSTLLTGRAPTTGPSARTQSVRAGIPDIPLRCEAIVNRATAPDPAARYPSAEAMLADIEAALAVHDAPLTLPRPVVRRPVRVSWQPRLKKLASLVATLGLTVLFGYFVSAPRDDGQRDAKAAEPEQAAPVVRVVKNSIGMPLALVPLGPFAMGDPFIADAVPQHSVYIRRPFLIGVHEVTQLQYLRVMGQNPSHFPGDNRPVEQVSWEEAKSFCEKLSELPAEQAAGRVYRLPTEAEWEYACRAGTRTPFAFPALTAREANFLGGGLGGTMPVGSYAANAWGLYDMHGNVGEWCQDWYGAYYYAECPNPAVEPTGPNTGRKRVVRGGSWRSPLEDCRSGQRFDFRPDYRGPDVGFRVVCTEK